MKRLISIFFRFRAANLALSGPSAPLLRPDGGRAGEVSAITLRRDKLTVEGKAPGGTVSLSMGQMRTSMTLPGAGGQFRLELPRPADMPLRQLRAELAAEGAVPRTLRLSHPAPAMAKLTAQFALTLLRLSPDLARWARHRDPRSKSRIKARLGLDHAHVAAGPLPADLFAPAPAPAPDGGAVTIVLPVFRALDLLRTCLDRIARHTDLPWTLIAIDDGSGDPEIRAALSAFAAAQPDGRVRLILRDENRGFVASVNTAFETILAQSDLSDRPVILLNTDAWVPEGWASRLVEPLRDDPAVASVTPMSNDAEIFSVPAICGRQDLLPGQADAIDALARQLPPGPARAEAPTGVGFCMALNPDYLRRVPRFDTAFGRGYGEEVDWCQKTRALGGRHVGTARLFVEHHGGGSFGSAQKTALISRNNRVISKRYPGYDREVQDFLTTDPLRAPRLALAVAWAATAAPDTAVPIYLAHAMGGGADHWLRRQIRLDAEKGLPSVVLRVGGCARWQVEVWGPGGSTAGWTDDTALLHRILAPLSLRRIVYSCGVGDRDPVALPALLQSLRQSPRDRIEVLFHDYLPISPSFTLLDGLGEFHGAVTPQRLSQLSKAAAAAHIPRRPDGQSLSLDHWQEAWGALLRDADLLRVFSPAAARFLAEVWPDLAGRVTVVPHQLLTELPRLPAPAPSQPPVLAVLGNIAPHKGAALVQQLARMTPEARGGDMVLIGNIDPAYPLPRGVRLHGDYSPADLPALVAHYGITHWLIPSVWPETFSFTTHEALATGLPVLAFDIGAQGDAVTLAGNGIAVPYHPGGDHAARVAEAFRAQRPRDRRRA